MAGKLILARRDGERVRLKLPGSVVVWVTLLEARSGKEKGTARLLFDAPESVEIAREELITAGSKAAR